MHALAQTNRRRGGRLFEPPDVIDPWSRGIDEEACAHLEARPAETITHCGRRDPALDVTEALEFDVVGDRAAIPGRVEDVFHREPRVIRPGVIVYSTARQRLPSEHGLGREHTCAVQSAMALDARRARKSVVEP